MRSGDNDPPEPILPDMFPWADETRGFIYDYVVQGNLLRFTTAFANQGEGDLELIGGEVISSDRRKVTQRVHFTDGSYQDLDAGEFTYHPGHAHIHFDGYAIYKLREKTADGQVGEVVATGGKISFCMVDVIRFDPEAGGSKFGQCESDYQGVTAGWSDVYDRSLPDQWINISGLDDGDYFLEIISDPENQILESDETNNVAIVPVTIQGGPGQSSDRFEVNNSFSTAYDLGTVSYRREDGLSIHNNLDVDYFKFTAVESGLMDVRLYFTHELGNLDFQIFDASRKLLRSAVTQSPTEAVQFEVTAEHSYFIQIFSSSSDTNGYSVEVDGPGNVTTVVVSSQDTPADIPDSSSQGEPGEFLETVVECPDLILSDLNLLLDDLQHPFASDLHIELTSPAGTTVTILTSAWEAGGAFLDGQGGFRNTILDDQSSVNVYSAELPLSGVYNITGTNEIEHPLSVFNGESARGLWTLRISDWFEQDAGVLNAWSLMFTGEQIDLGDAYEINEDFPHAVDLRSLGFVELNELSIHSGLDQDFFRFNSNSDHLRRLPLNSPFPPAIWTSPFMIQFGDCRLRNVGRGQRTSPMDSQKGRTVLRRSLWSRPSDQ
ncbi:MAG: lysyl oxidase family protein [Pirellulaceae bacterium]